MSAESAEPPDGKEGVYKGSSSAIGTRIEAATNDALKTELVLFNPHVPVIPIKLRTPLHTRLSQILLAVALLIAVPWATRLYAFIHPLTT